jgi:ribonuclease HI
MLWRRHRLRDNEVWANVDAEGRLVTDRDGRVDIVYKAVPGAKVYRAGGRNLVALDAKSIELEPGERAADKDAAKTGATARVPADAIHVWTDGACTGNPGPAGVGVVIVDGGKTEELSEYLGEGTNNIAELTAILRGLETVLDRGAVERPVVVYSDSQYSIGLLTQAWKAKANAELVADLRAVCRRFKDLRFVKVAGHSGVPLNERTDELARQAVSRRR